MNITQTAQAVHPGSILQRELDARELTPAQAARAFGVKVGEVRAVLSARVERVWGTPANLWDRLQAQHDAHPARHGGARVGQVGPPAVRRRRRFG